MYLNEVEKLPVLDEDAAMKELNDRELLETIMLGFEDMTMRGSLAKLKAALENANYTNVRICSHALKGAASYIHAERVRAQSSNLQTAVDNKHYENAAKYYCELIKECIVLKKRIRLEKCKKKGKIFIEDSSDFDVPIAKGYKIVKKSQKNFNVVSIKKSSKTPIVGADENVNSMNRQAQINGATKEKRKTLDKTKESEGNGCLIMCVIFLIHETCS
eukprot:TRINITY_DN878_c0_g1_i4.p1 TRINITY_DN878_c0_g1~~TRINITY_DN878_c0_g1_i4.p1  ORF type:complete len:217 (+),score=44.28 TRINITY_DN878_c0_g1_i4:204-854(+)